MEVQNGMHLITPADVVADPSAPDAFVNGIMENVEFWYDNERGFRIQEYTEDTKNTLKTFTTKQIEQAKIKLFEDYLNEVAKNLKI
jgi:hypothetical protein